MPNSYYTDSIKIQYENKKVNLIDFLKFFLVSVNKIIVRCKIYELIDHLVHFEILKKRKIKTSFYWNR